MVELKLNKMKIYKNKFKKGFTLLETLVSVSIFTIVITVGLSALLNANSLDHKSKDLRAIIDNLSFIMEDISRNIRVGTHYRCYDATAAWDGTDYGLPQIEEPRSCTGTVGAGAEAIAFEPSNGVDGNPLDQWVYKLENGNIYKSEDGGSSAGFSELNKPGEIIINSFSTFSVTGAEDPPPTGICNASNDCQQPLIIIKISGYINYKGTQTPFALQNTISQRFGDNP